MSAGAPRSPGPVVEVGGSAAASPARRLIRAVVRVVVWTLVLGLSAMLVWVAFLLPGIRRGCPPGRDAWLCTWPGVVIAGAWLLLAAVVCLRIAVDAAVRGAMRDAPWGEVLGPLLVVPLQVMSWLVLLGPIMQADK